MNKRDFYFPNVVTGALHALGRYGTLGARALELSSGRGRAGMRSL